MTPSTSAQTSVSEATAAEQRAHEPSMEEILASIRRIIADDQLIPITRPAARDPAPARSPAPDIEQPVAPAPAEPIEKPAPAPQAFVATPLEPAAPRRIEAPIRAVRAEPKPASAPIPQNEAPRDQPPLLSPEIGASVGSAFNALATTVVLQNQGMIEEATRELLRPMLKQWLDDNLPVMVERLVRFEIERVARGGR